MEPSTGNAIGEAWSMLMERNAMNEAYDLLCRAHPGYRDPANERRAALKSKQAELGEGYARWYFLRFMSIEEFDSVSMLRTIDNQGEYHANTR